MKYFVYMVRCADGSLYTGITTDLDRRIGEHNGIGDDGAKYTRAKRPVVLVYSQEFANRSEASKEEWRIKQMTKDDKEALLTPKNKLL